MIQIEILDLDFNMILNLLQIYFNLWKRYFLRHSPLKPTVYYDVSMMDLAYNCPKTGWFFANLKVPVIMP
jgi:hypothetical protein